MLIMAQVVKTIKGRKYTYNVKWDPERKKQIWTYIGKIEKKIDPEKLKGELYSAIMKQTRIQKNDRRKIMHAIQKVIEKYEDYW